MVYIWIKNIVHIQKYNKIRENDPVKEKKIKAKVAEKMDYYIDKNGNMRGKPIKFSRK